MLSICGFAQKVTVSELLELKGNSYDDFDTYATKKGYKFNDAIKDDSTARYIYRTPNSMYTLIYYTEKDIYSQMRYVTLDKNEYIEMKNGLKRMGYKFGKQASKDGKMQLFYSLNFRAIMLESQSIDSEITMYSFVQN